VVIKKFFSFFCTLKKGKCFFSFCSFFVRVVLTLCLTISIEPYLSINSINLHLLESGAGCFGLSQLYEQEDPEYVCMKREVGVEQFELAA
jgi:hypothetical protein